MRKWGVLERGVILRLSYKSVEPLGEDKLEVRSISGFETFKIRLFKVELDSLILQHPSSTDTIRYRGPMRILPRPWVSYCKWHSGPLDSRDKPWERIYCNVRAEGYCRQHRRSDRYLYDMCMGLKGKRALEACRILDKRVRTEYALYLLDSGGSKPKVGVTRTFRLYERIAEQNHVVATLLAVYERAEEARRAEMKISELGFATEHQRGRRSKLGRGHAALRLAETAEKVSKFLGHEWSGMLFTIVHEEPLPKRVDLNKAIGEEFYPVGYWGGLILVRGREGVYSLEERPMLHRLAVEIPTEDHMRKGELLYGYLEA